MNLSTWTISWSHRLYVSFRLVDSIFLRVFQQCLGAAASSRCGFGRLGLTWPTASWTRQCIPPSCNTAEAYYLTRWILWLTTRRTTFGSHCFSIWITWATMPKSSNLNWLLFWMGEACQTLGETCCPKWIFVYRTAHFMLTRQNMSSKLKKKSSKFSLSRN